MRIKPTAAIRSAVVVGRPSAASCQPLWLGLRPDNRTSGDSEEKCASVFQRVDVLCHFTD